MPKFTTLIELIIVVTLMKKYVGFFILLLVLSACHRNPLKIDVSKINLAVKIGRLDQDLFQVTPENIKSAVPELQKRYDPFFSLYNKEVLAIGDSRDSLYEGYLLTF